MRNEDAGQKHKNLKRSDKTVIEVIIKVGKNRPEMGSKSKLREDNAKDECKKRFNVMYAYQNKNKIKNNQMDESSQQV